MNYSNPIRPRNVAGPIIDDEIMANERAKESSGGEVENRNKNEFDFLRNMQTHSSLSSTHLCSCIYLQCDTCWLKMPSLSHKLWLFSQKWESWSCLDLRVLLNIFSLWTTERARKIYDFICMLIVRLWESSFYCVASERLWCCPQP